MTSAGGAQQFSFVQATNVLTILTAIGGSFTVDLDDGAYSYTGPSMINANLNEVITYRLTDNDGDTASNTLTVTILNGDRAPIVRDDNVITNISGGGASIVIPEYALLYNDTDPDGQSIAVSGVSGANSGSVSRAGGNVTFTDSNPGGGSNTDGGSFTYTGLTTAPCGVGHGSCRLTRVSGSTLNGTGLAEILIGGTGNDTINGFECNDVLIGNGGNDSLYGGLGNDLLVGGAGSDKFVFNTALNATTNVDIIRDFDASDSNEQIQLSQSIFAAIGGTLSASEFTSNTTGLATTTDHHIIFNTTTGELFYDSNGSAAGGAVKFAVVTITAGTFDQEVTS